MTAPAWAAAPPARGDVEPDWLRKPDGDQLKAAFPAALHGTGKAVIHCRVNTAGLLENCRVVSETPAGKGVGAAALLLAPNFLMRPAMKGGKPATGEVNIPINFSGAEWLAGPRIEALLHPLWLQAPTTAEVAAAVPKGAPPQGHAAMRCSVEADGSLRRCEVLSENPGGRGFGSAAKSLAARFRVYTDPAKSDYRNVRVTVPVAFEAHPAELRYITAPDWRLKPSADQVIAVYPDKAVKDGIKTGRGTAECVVKADGTLAACQAVAEEPAAEGFGEAAQRLAGYMSIGVWSQDGKAVDGARIRIPFRFNYAEPSTPQAH
jgi:hypothetical protein